MDTEDVVHTYNGISFSHEKNEIMQLAARVDLVSVTVSELTQTEEEKYCMTSLRCGI